MKENITTNVVSNNKIEQPLISVLIPIYNEEHKIKRCVDSILNQTYKNIEIIIVDDGSTDNTIKVLDSIKKDNIFIYKKSHNGISAALNYGLNRCNGEYIARMDADDIMLENRLELQYNYFIKNQNCDILSTGFYSIDENNTKTLYTPKQEILTIDSLLEFNKVVHPTVMFKHNSLNKLKYRYESLYDGCEDYKFWFNCLQYNLEIHIIETPTIIYDNSKHQLETVCSKQKININRIKNIFKKVNNAELTCIIGFFNEGVELEKTVSSIRATTKSVNILLIDDCSTDNYDYQNVARLYDCEYYKTDTNKGVAGCRNYGVHLCKTDYFVILDAHMRFYKDGWDELILKELKKDDKQILCSCTIGIVINENYEYYNEDGKDRKYIGKGAYINFMHQYNMLTLRQLIETLTNDDLIQIPCILGAVYAMSTRWWKLIGGLAVLKCYGGDEQMLSISTYLKGGKCILLNNFISGHIYKTKRSYEVNEEKIFNLMFLFYIYFGKDKFNNHIKNFIKTYSEKTISKITKIFYENKNEIERIFNIVNSNNEKTIDDFVKFNAEYLFKLQTNI